MVFALAGDSTMTSFVTRLGLSWRLAKRSVRMSRARGQERYPVAGVPLQASGELQLQQGHPQKRGRQLTLPEQFVNRHRAGAEPALDQAPRGFIRRIKGFI